MNHLHKTWGAARAGILAIGALAAVLGGAPHAVAQEAVSVRLKWLGQTQFAGVYVAKAKGFYKADGLDVTINPGGPNLNAESLVASGADTFAIGGGIESSLASRDKKLPIVTLGMFHQRTPFVMVAMEDGPVKTLADFKGKKITAFFTGAQHTVTAMMRKQGFQPSDYSLTAQAVSMTPFLNREVDVAMTTLYNELIIVRNRGAKVRVFAPDDYGLSVPRDTLITHEKVVAGKPKVVQAFTNATLRGWKYAIKNPVEATEIVMAASPGLDKAHQLQMLTEVSKLMLADGGTTQGLGYMDLEKYKVAQAVMVDAKVISGPVDFSATFLPRFWNAVPAADKKM
ncbi:MAG: ABC transporter substrate-binding protein [Betaproteobacteria bacterium]|nr:ABC transporter substrate-binding protein [Betaproteobacteria bacterium]